MFPCGCQGAPNSPGKMAGGGEGTWPETKEAVCNGDMWGMGLLLDRGGGRGVCVRKFEVDFATQEMGSCLFHLPVSWPWDPAGEAPLSDG